MLRFTILAALVCYCYSAIVFTDDTLRFESASSASADAQWTSFKQEHGKQYSATEESYRRDVFMANLKMIHMHNYLASKGQKSFTLGVNQFTDMENEEFVRTMNGFKQSNRSRIYGSSSATYMSPLTGVNLPDTVDWRKHGFVTPVKDQGQCGSCWAFSTTGSLEGQHFRSTGKLVSLSEQNLVDCSGKYGNNGCYGGIMDYAFQYIQENDGIDTEESYPYTAIDGQCKFKTDFIGATDKGFVDIAQFSETKLKEAVATIGPISVGIDASKPTFQSYKSGIYDEPECNPGSLDHGVLVVGYGTEEGKDYWLVKNSWSTKWGDNGYIKMSRNKHNQCGIATEASYPLV